MDYLHAKFGDSSFSRFGFIVRTDRQNHRITDRITEVDDHYTHATTVSVSKYKTKRNKINFILDMSIGQEQWS